MQFGRGAGIYRLILINATLVEREDHQNVLQELCRKLWIKEKINRALWPRLTLSKFELRKSLKGLLLVQSE
jgi:hypothetical protein